LVVVGGWVVATVVVGAAVVVGVVVVDGRVVATLVVGAAFVVGVVVVDGRVVATVVVGVPESTTVPKACVQKMRPTLSTATPMPIERADGISMLALWPGDVSQPCMTDSGDE
jgi:hypothetical protein